ncbi:MAG: hypothetical protein R3A44_27275 [Caldilineaceae bacterium]
MDKLKNGLMVIGAFVCIVVILAVAIYFFSNILGGGGGSDTMLPSSEAPVPVISEATDLPTVHKLQLYENDTIRLDGQEISLDELRQRIGAEDSKIQVERVDSVREDFKREVEAILREAEADYEFVDIN